MKKMFLFIIITSTYSFAQTIYELPFASQGNQIELTVANTSGVSLQNVTISVEETPAWISFDNRQTTISKIRSNNEVAVLFEFSVDKSAPVGEAGTILFKIKSPLGDKWRKEINVAASKPTTYELSQNYPNPFNPATKIEFIIPNDEKVTLKVYDILGREVKTLVNDFLEAGHHEIMFNADQLASGTYIYRLNFVSYQQIKKMMLVK